MIFLGYGNHRYTRGCFESLPYQDQSSEATEKLIPHINESLDFNVQITHHLIFQRTFYFINFHALTILFLVFYIFVKHRFYILHFS